jgi:uncharacterized damage-inducible protein DinB
VSRTLFLLAASGLLAPAQTLTRGERDRAMSELHATRKQFIDSLDGLTEAQWKFKPAPDRWSIAETADHILKTEDLLMQLIQGKILKSDAAPGQKSEVADELVLKKIEDRSQKAQAPESLQPAGALPDREALIAQFKQKRDGTIAYVEKTQDPLRAHFFRHPAVGTVDAYQWLLILAAHTNRHVQQIEEVKADPRYPK